MHGAVACKNILHDYAKLMKKKEKSKWIEN
jgi:hypothetical protein